MAIKEKLGVTFTPTEIANANSVKSIIEIIESIFIKSLHRAGNHLLDYFITNLTKE